MAAEQSPMMVSSGLIQAVVAVVRWDLRRDGRPRDGWFARWRDGWNSDGEGEICGGGATGRGEMEAAEDGLAGGLVRRG